MVCSARECAPPTEPARLVVEAYRDADDRTPAIRIVADYAACEGRGAHPLWLRVVAGARIAAVAEILRRPVQLDLRPLLRLLGRLVRWVAPPSPPALPAPSAPRLSASFG